MPTTDDPASAPKALRILVFTEGTLLIPGPWASLSRSEAVRRSREGGSPAASDFAGNVPVKRSVGKVRAWVRSGASILYLTSRRTPEEVAAIQDVLRRHGFPPGDLLFRKGGETYSDVAERVMPDVIVEDDCESIGGEAEMTYPRIRDDRRRRITSVVVPEFGGVDHLPDRASELLRAD